MINECPSCGGPLHFDAALGKLKCEYCESLFDPESPEVSQATKNVAATESVAVTLSDAASDATANAAPDTAANAAPDAPSRTAAKVNENAQEYNIRLFSCPNCGAEIASTDLEAVEYCLYCGSFVTLEAQAASVRRPDCIIPFEKTKEDCTAAYKKSMFRRLYAPKAFRDESFLQSFKGIYIPFWMYDYTYGPTMKIPAVTETRNGDFIYKQHQNIICEGEGSVKGISYDASSTFDDEVSGGILPFDSRKLKDFNPAYMYGYFADVADVAETVYEKDADEQAAEEIWGRITRETEVKKDGADRPVGTAFKTAFHLKGKSKLAMLPVWFLTWRNRDRVAYSVVNGESGQLYAEIPVDPMRYLLLSLLTAIPIFLLLNLGFTFNGGKMLIISALLALVTVFLSIYQLERIARRILHSDDKGFLSTHDDSRRESGKLKQSLLMLPGGFLKDLISDTDLGDKVVAIIIAVLCIREIILGLIIAAVLVPIYVLYRVGKIAGVLKDKSVWLDVSGSLAAILIAGLVRFLDPADDLVYYYTALLCMAGVGFTAIRTMLRYNQLVTRPLPHFFDREEGGKV